MNSKKRSTLLGAALIIFGIILGFGVGQLLALPLQEEKAPLRRWLPGLFLKQAEQTQPPPTAPVGGTWQKQAVFSVADGKKISMQYGEDCFYRPDVGQLLLQRLDWELGGGEPTVLILHTHASESYTRLTGENYVQTGDYRTLDTQYNMVALGDLLARRLEAAGIGVIHDRDIHDYPSYNNSYTNARSCVQDYLRQYPSIRVVLDLHRDALLLSDGSQFAPAVMAGGESVARLMLVVGTDGSGMHHPAWQENLAIAAKLQVLLERQCPGITRPILLRAQRFNHDLSTGAMIVEVGAAGNTLREAENAILYLADAIIALAHGAVTENSTS